MSHFNRQLLTALLGVAFGLPLLFSNAALAGDDFTEAVRSYRRGDYLKAEKAFEAGHKDHPGDVRYTYYLAISRAQLGRFGEARDLYNEVILLAPNSEAAILARQGLASLPPVSGNGLDLPPKFVQPTQTAVQNAVQAGKALPTSAPSGMTPQQMMMLQMVMGGGNNNGSSWMTPAMMGMYGYPAQAGQRPGGQGQYGQYRGSGVDPSIMSQMMLNQMLRNFDFSGGDDND